jgi:hypothetical protein
MKEGEIPALIFAGAFLICSLVFLNIFLKDRETMEDYKAYQKKLLLQIREYDLGYEPKTLSPSANPKNVVLALAGLMIVAIVALASKNKTFLMIAVVFFLIFLGGYVYLDYIEGERITIETRQLEKDLEDMEDKMGV